jgi:hypothetical protein
MRTFHPIQRFRTLYEYYNEQPLFGTKRARFKRRVLLMTFPRQTAEYPLEIGMVLWGLYTGLNAVLGQPPSRSIQDLPQTLSRVWAGLMIVASITVCVGVFFHGRDSTTARGLYLYSATMTAYAAAILGASGWRHGGSVAVLLLALSLVCLLRGWWLKDRETTLINEMNRFPEGS